MKVEFKHKLIIGESRVFEVLALMMALIEPRHRKNIIDLSEYDSLRDHYQETISVIQPFHRFHFVWLEYALIVPERKSVHRFFEGIKNLSPAMKLVYFLGSEINTEDAEKALKSKHDLRTLLKQLDLLDEKLLDHLFQLDPFLDLFGDFALAINDSKPFNTTWDKLQEDNAFQALKKQFHDNMAHRHPLSYAQEIMGKPFWNIADYKKYEFVPSFFMSPIRLRYMDADTQIYVHPLIQMPKAEQLSETDIANSIKLLSDPNRLKILKMLYLKPMYGKEIADATGLTTATVSHHLESLRQRGLVNLEAYKQIKYFSTNPNNIKTLLDAVELFLKSKN